MSLENSSVDMIKIRHTKMVLPMLSFEVRAEVDVD
jgi:hypothetical protein